MERQWPCRQDVMIGCAHVQRDLASTEMALGRIQAACEQVKNSPRLQRTFALILVVGNILNAGSRQGGALAIKLNCLAKLADTKVSGCVVPEPSLQCVVGSENCHTVDLCLGAPHER